MKGKIILKPLSEALPLKHVLVVNAWTQIADKQQQCAQQIPSEMLNQFAQTLPCMTSQRQGSRNLPL